MMLVLSRKQSEKLIIGDNIIVTVAAISGNRVRLAIQAPADVQIHRSEIRESVRAEEEACACSSPRRASRKQTARRETGEPSSKRPLSHIRRGSEAKTARMPVELPGPSSMPAAAAISGY